MLLREQIDWQILKAREWSAGRGLHFSVPESLYLRLADVVLDHEIG
jgi:hypothetical protein